MFETFLLASNQRQSSDRMKLSFMSGSWIIYECSSYPWVPYPETFIIVWRGYNCDMHIWVPIHYVLFEFRVRLILSLTVSFISFNQRSKTSLSVLFGCRQGLVCLLLLSSEPFKKSLCGKLFSRRWCVLTDKTHVRQNIRNQQVALDIQFCFCNTVYFLVIILQSHSLSRIIWIQNWRLFYYFIMLPGLPL